MTAESQAEPVRKRPPGPGRGHKVKQGNGYVPNPPQGPGWGGPAKGAGTPESFAAVRNMRRSPEEREALADEALETMVKVMRDSDYEGVRLAAAEKVRNQVLGTPVQRTIIDNQPIETRDTIDPRLLSAEQRRFLRQLAEIAASDRAMVISDTDADDVP